MKKLKSALIILALTLLPLIVLPIAKLTKDDRAMLQFLDANYRAGILQPQSTLSPTLSSTLSDPKFIRSCGLAVKSEKSPLNAWAIQQAISCSKNVPHTWSDTNWAFLCSSGDLVVAVWDNRHTNTTTPWPALTFQAEGQYTNSWHWGPVTKTANMQARCRTIMAQPFIQCPDNPPPPTIGLSVRCSPGAPLYLDPGPPSTVPTNRIQATPVNGTIQLHLRDWAPGRTVEIFENPQLQNPWWIPITTVLIGPDGTATTNISPVFPLAFYRARATQ